MIETNHNLSYFFLFILVFDFSIVIMCKMFLNFILNKIE